MAGPLIQPKALAFAEAHSVPFSVSRAAGALETRVADVPKAVWRANQEAAIRLRVVPLGLGTVGRGVINGTCNSVLGALARAESFDQAVRSAQAAGFAEADPVRDLSGADTADKLSPILQAAFGVHVQSGQIPTRGIEASLVSDAAQVWRLIAQAVRAHETLTYDDGEIIRLAGQGASRWPTTAAVMGDVHEWCDASRSRPWNDSTYTSLVKNQ